MVRDLNLAVRMISMTTNLKLTIGKEGPQSGVELLATTTMQTMGRGTISTTTADLKLTTMSMRGGTTLTIRGMATGKKGP